MAATVIKTQATRDVTWAGRSRAVAASVAAVLGVACLAVSLRAVFPTADPPWHATVGVVWHDEGAWVHNARNRALFGEWRLDEWNPMYLTPVFTGLEYLSFAAFGVGLWQARLVSVTLGLVSVLLLGLGVSRIANRTAGVFAAALLAANYVYVMYNRAAIIEATMVALLVVSWYAYARAMTTPIWGLAAGTAAVLAFFAKASAAFFAGALGLSALLAIAGPRLASRGWKTLAPGKDDPAAATLARAGWFTLIGLALAGAVALAVFVVPFWDEVRFYNWQMTVTRKPSYDLRSFMDRASWFPIIHDFFTRMWFVTILGAAALIGVLVRWRRRLPAEHLLALWIGLGVLELIVHEVGNERRLVFLIPPLVALAALTVGRDFRLLPPEIAGLSRRTLLLAAPIVLFVLYVVAGALVRLAFLYEVRPGVRWSALVAVLLGALLYATWPRAPRWLAQPRWSLTVSALLVLLVIAGDLAQFVQWARVRTYRNYEASVALGELLPPGTAVHGKLANGLSLENQIRPIFVGRGFGNYEDRLERHDVQYLVTYTAPWIGYEGPVITDVLEIYPDWRIVATFDVAESAGGHDRAALIVKGQPRLSNALASDGTRRAPH